MNLLVCLGGCAFGLSIKANDTQLLTAEILFQKWVWLLRWCGCCHRLALCHLVILNGNAVVLSPHYPIYLGQKLSFFITFDRVNCSIFSIEKRDLRELSHPQELYKGNKKILCADNFTKDEDGCRYIFARGNICMLRLSEVKGTRNIMLLKETSLMRS